MKCCYTLPFPFLVPLQEIILTLDTHIMSLRVTRKTSQIYLLEQIPRHHMKMERHAGGTVKGPESIVAVNGFDEGPERLYLALRVKKQLEVK